MSSYAPEVLRRLLKDAGADPELTFLLLEQLNREGLAAQQAAAADFPSARDPRILDMAQAEFQIPNAEAEQLVRRLDLPGTLESWARRDKDLWVWGPSELEQLGLFLFRKYSYGVLNGGSATSYADLKKNAVYGQDILELYRSDLAAYEPLLRDQPKGCTPAFLHPDGSPGPDYLELKLRALLISCWRSQKAFGSYTPLAPFQMTSAATDGPVAQALERYRSSPYLVPWMEATGWDPTQVLTATQGLIGTFTPPDPQGQRGIFVADTAQGPRCLALPGGHGQNFRVLAPLQQKLEQQGGRWVSLGNIDNLGYLPDPLALALLALRGDEAGFDFSWRTPLDIKGGVLYQEPSGRLNCGDLGVALDRDQAFAAEAAGRPLFFNCATGLFDLNILNRERERWSRDLPLRLSEQDKDIGRYAQVEQVTWEVLGLMDRPVIFAVAKQERFLAAKLLVESFLTSGRRLDDPVFQKPEHAALQTLAGVLHGGLKKLLAGPYRLSLRQGRWEPLDPPG